MPDTFRLAKIVRSRDLYAKHCHWWVAGTNLLCASALTNNKLEGEEKQRCKELVSAIQSNKVEFLSRCINIFLAAKHNVVIPR